VYFKASWRNPLYFKSASNRVFQNAVQLTARLQIIRIMTSLTRPAVAPVTETHEVLNQVGPLTGYNVFLSDHVLAAAVRREGAGWAEGALSELGHLLGSEEAQRWGVDANENPPVLHTHDSAGRRRDEVVFHPAWHNLMRTSIEHKVHSLPFLQKRPGAYVARAALMMMTVQNEAGHTCPVSMTFSGMAALQAEPDLAREWEAKVLSPVYDPRFLPMQQKNGVLLGMGMTEKQGGSDVRANTTRAERLGDHGKEFLITGHKWFCSAPMCDAFLILAQTAKGLTCFLLPRWTPDGAKNNFHIQRLKDKMGNRSNASSEVEFDRAWATQVGEDGRGVNTIIEMVNNTRLDCATASAGLMRQALAQAVHYCRHRQAFGKRLVEQPLMQNVLADLTVESEAATLLVMRLAASFDARQADERNRAFSRIATAICKFWLCKRSPVHVGEALECLGGNGYVEESAMPRLYREAPLYGIWEGSGNVICLDILRALSKDPATAEALLEELKTVSGADLRLDRLVASLETDMHSAVRKTVDHSHQAGARRLAERLAIALQGACVLRHGRKEVAEAFLASRVAGDHGHTFGTLPESADVERILAGSIA